MSGSVRWGIVAASLCATVALMWGGVGLLRMFMDWGSAHPEAMKAMPLLPIFPIIISVIVAQTRRRSNR
jgi:hypothetical protein